MSSTARALRIIIVFGFAVTTAAFGFIWGVIVGGAVDVDRANAVQMAGGILIVFGLLTILAVILHSGAQYRDRPRIARAVVVPADGLRVLRLQEPTE